MSIAGLLCLIGLVAAGLLLWAWWMGADDPDNYPGGQR